jgi:hypothetical protein
MKSTLVNCEFTFSQLKPSWKSVLQFCLFCFFGIMSHDFTLKGPVEDEEFHKEAVRLGSFPRGERPEPYFYKGLCAPPSTAR